MSVAVFGIGGTTAFRCVVSVVLDPLTRATQSLIGYTERRFGQAAPSVLGHPWSQAFIVEYSRRAPQLLSYRAPMAHCAAIRWASILVFA